jgi:uncharacterized membrane protein YebE (DUF533 family)
LKPEAIHADDAAMFGSAATGLLGTMLGSAFGKHKPSSSSSSGPGIGTVAAGVAGVAAVGGLSYLAYQHFAQKPGAPGAMPGGVAHGGAAPGGGGIAGMMTGFVGRTDGLQTSGFSVPGYEWQTPAAQQPATPPPQQSWAQQPQAIAPQQNWQQPSPAIATPAAPAAPAGDPAQQKQALLLIRAMIAAAYSDGVLDDKERADFIARLDQAGVTAEERALFLAELSAPKPVTMLTAEVDAPDLAEQFYVVSVLAITADTPAERAHLQMLPALLRLSPDQVAAIHQKTGIPSPNGG